MTDFGQALRQDMLEKPLHKLGCRQPDVLDLLSAVVAVVKGDLAVFQAFQA